MELKHSFVVTRPVEEAWSLLTDLGRVAPCMPGANLEEVDGDRCRGTLKVKVGPIVAAYRGEAALLERDDHQHTATIRAEGRDPRQGNAEAVISAQLIPEGDRSTRVELTTDLTLSGKLAAFGTGAIRDVSKNVLDRFVANLEAELGEPVAGQPRAEARPSEGEPLDLISVAGAPIKRAGAALLLVVAAVVVVVLLRRRQR